MGPFIPPKNRREEPEPEPNRPQRNRSRQPRWSDFGFDYFEAPSRRSISELEELTAMMEELERDLREREEQRRRHRWWSRWL